MKASMILVVFFACLAMSATPTLADDTVSTNQRQPKYFTLGRLFFPILFPHAMSPKPSKPKLGPMPIEEATKCWLVVHHKSMASCAKDFHDSFVFQKISIHKECCKALDHVKDDCAKVIHFHNPFFQHIVKEYCEAKAAPPS